MTWYVLKRWADPVNLEFRSRCWEKRIYGTFIRGGSVVRHTWASVTTFQSETALSPGNYLDVILIYFPSYVMVGNVIPTCTMCTDNIFASDVTFFSCRWEVVGVNSGCTRCSSVSRNHIAGGHRENHMGLLCKTVRYSIFFFFSKNRELLPYLWV